MSFLLNSSDQTVSDDDLCNASSSSRQIFTSEATTSNSSHKRSLFDMQPRKTDLVDSLFSHIAPSNDANLLHGNDSKKHGVDDSKERTIGFDELLVHMMNYTDKTLKHNRTTPESNVTYSRNEQPFLHDQSNVACTSKKTGLADLTGSKIAGTENYAHQTISKMCELDKPSTSKSLLENCGISDSDQMLCETPSRRALNKRSSSETKTEQRRTRSRMAAKDDLEEYADFTQLENASASSVIVHSSSDMERSEIKNYSLLEEKGERIIEKDSTKRGQEAVYAECARAAVSNNLTEKDLKCERHEFKKEPFLAEGLPIKEELIVHDFGATTSDSFRPYKREMLPTEKNSNVSPEDVSVLPQIDETIVEIKKESMSRDSHASDFDLTNAGNKDISSETSKNLNGHAAMRNPSIKIEEELDISNVSPKTESDFHRVEIASPNHGNNDFNYTDLSGKSVMMHSEQTAYKIEPCSSQTLNPTTGQFETPRDGSRNTKNRNLLKRRRDEECSCAMCEKNFTRKTQLKYHIMSHFNLRPHKCGNCSKTFVQTSTLSTHMIHVHSDEKPFECSQCSKRFKTSKALESHLFVHTDLKPYDCKPCGKRYKTKGSLRKHKLKHSSDKLYHCDICAHPFTTRNGIKNHIQHHSIARPHKCLQCPKRFKNKGSLRAHKAVHSKETPFECCHCNKQFKSKESLKFHMVTHYSDRPHECSACGKRYKLRSQLVQHAVVHFDEWPFKCPNCEKSFKWKAKMNQHRKTHDLPMMAGTSKTSE